MRTIDETLLPRGSRVLCAVSGGADSMCLLNLLSQERERLGIELLAAHFEHGLRGEESLRDAEFVRGVCEGLGLECRIGHGDVKGCATRRGLGVEEAARELRYAFLERTARELCCTRIATAHTADDQAETLLLNLIRGAGARGLAGIPRQRGIIVRPLLDWERCEVEAWLRERGIAWVEDSSNGGDEYRRNRLRHQVIPLLREMNPRFAAAASGTASLLRQDEDCLDAMAAGFLERWEENGAIPIGALSALHPAVASRVLRRLCPRALTREHVDAILRLCEGSGAAAVDVPGLRVRREQGKLCFREEAGLPLPERELRCGESLQIPEAGLRISAEQAVFSGEREIHGLFKTYFFKSETICGKILCTGRRPGERMRPQGRGLSKSLKQLFLEAGIPASERQSVPVLRDEKGILAVIGLAADERVRPERGDPVLRVRVEGLERPLAAPASQRKGNNRDKEATNGESD